MHDQAWIVDRSKLVDAPIGAAVVDKDDFVFEPGGQGSPQRSQACLGERQAVEERDDE